VSDLLNPDLYTCLFIITKRMNVGTYTHKSYFTSVDKKINKNNPVSLLLLFYLKWFITAYFMKGKISFVPFILEYSIPCFRKSRIIDTVRFRCLFCLKFSCNSSASKASKMKALPYRNFWLGDKGVDAQSKG